MRETGRRTQREREREFVCGRDTERKGEKSEIRRRVKGVSVGKKREVRSEIMCKHKK